MTATARRQALVAMLAGWLVWCTLSLAQETPPPADDAAVEADDGATDDDGEYDPANDIFAPSETIRADSEISFPSDI